GSVLRASYRTRDHPGRTTRRARAQVFSEEATMTRKLNLKLLATCLLAPLVVAVAATAASSPSVATGSTTKTTTTTSVLEGVVNPNGSATTYYFQWGLTNSYGVMSASHSAGR